jgi:hypothetical protein
VSPEINGSGNNNVTTRSRLSEAFESSKHITLQDLESKAVKLSLTTTAEDNNGDSDNNK